MNYDIKLYAHGVPKGQCSWGVGNLDGNYIDTFYGRKSSVPTQMFVEIRQFGSSVYSYYTYFVGNTSDYSGRSGGYFALTLRINYYYADIQNIYNLLDAAFKKFIIGSVINTVSSVFKYGISDFLQVDDNLKALEQEIYKYLMQFSSDSDFVPLNGFKVNGQDETATLNLLECDVKVIAKHIKNYSSIAISPHYPSSREQQIIKGMNDRINAVTTQAQKEIAIVKQERERDIQNIKKQYKDADKIIENLQETNNKANEEIKRLGNTVNELTKKAEDNEKYKTKFEESQRKLEKSNAIISKVYDSISGAEVLRMPANMSHDHKLRRGSKPNEENDRFSFIKIVRGIHPFTDFFVMIVLLGIVGFTLPKSCAGSEDSSKELLAANERIEQLEKQIKSIQNINKDLTSNTGDIDTLRRKFPNAQIDITGISENKPMRYGNTYSVSLKNVNVNELGGKWESNDFEISNGKLKPKHIGICKISYVVNGEVFVSKEIAVDTVSE